MAATESYGRSEQPANAAVAPKASTVHYCISRTDEKPKSCRNTRYRSLENSCRPRLVQLVKPCLEVTLLLVLIIELPSSIDKSLHPFCATSTTFHDQVTHRRTCIIGLYKVYSLFEKQLDCLSFKVERLDGQGIKSVAGL